MVILSRELAPEGADRPVADRRVVGVAQGGAGGADEDEDGTVEGVVVIVFSSSCFFDLFIVVVTLALVQRRINLTKEIQGTPSDAAAQLRRRRQGARVQPGRATPDLRAEVVAEQRERRRRGLDKAQEPREGRRRRSICFLVFAFFIV
jgi:hypothetical protein